MEEITNPNREKNSSQQSSGAVTNNRSTGNAFFVQIPRASTHLGARTCTQRFACPTDSPLRPFAPHAVGRRSK